MDELGRNTAESNHDTEKRNIVIVLDNIRSGNNVGSILRTSDAFGVHSVQICGFSPYPPDRQVLKASLGAEISVHWRHWPNTIEAVQELAKTHHIWVVEQTTGSMDIGQGFDSQVDKPIALVFGNEVNGVDPAILPFAERCVEVPQWGHKHSLNVAVCAGVVLWELCRVSED